MKNSNPNHLITEAMYQARFGLDSQLPQVENKFQHNGLIARQLARTTCRQFWPTPIPNELLELMIGAAQSSPTSGGLQSYSVLALTTKEDKDRLFEHELNKEVIGGVDSWNMRVYYEAPVFLIWIADLNRNTALLTEAVTNGQLHDLNCIDLVHGAEMNVKAIVDTTIIAQSFCMIAESYGMGTMYCGAIRYVNPQWFQKFYNVPELCMPIFGMAVGWPRLIGANGLGDSTRSLVKTRIPTKNILHYGSYSPVTHINDLGTYNVFHALRSDEFGYSPTGKYFTFVERVIERFQLTRSKMMVGSWFRSMKFWFN